MPDFKLSDRDMIEGIFGFDILASETFWGRNIWEAFFQGGLIQVGNFFGYSIQSVDSDGMMNRQTQTQGVQFLFFPIF